MTREIALNILHNASVYHPEYLDALNLAIKALEQEPKKGKWEYDANKDKSGGHCNKCGHFLRYGEKTNFCPDCGADNREVLEDGNN